MDRGNPMDAEVMDAVERPQQQWNEVLRHFASCEELTAWHDGRGNVERYGSVSAVKVGGTLQPIAMLRTQYLEAVEHELPKMDAADIQEELNSHLEDIEIKQVQIVGVLDRDEYGLYAAILGAAAPRGAGNTSPKPYAAIVAYTMLRSLPISVNLAMDAEPGAFDHLLAELKPYVRRLVITNQ